LATEDIMQTESSKKPESMIQTTMMATIKVMSACPFQALAEQL
jgi:hypothetical protein